MTWLIVVVELQLGPFGWDCVLITITKSISLILSVRSRL